MMQSAGVLPTESPVKSLPEVLGVPLHRKTRSMEMHAHIQCLYERVRSVCRGGGARSLQATVMNISRHLEL